MNVENITNKNITNDYKKIIDLKKDSTKFFLLKLKNGMFQFCNLLGFVAR